uniref:Putative sigma-70 region domain containing protein n=1 Tax=viral metagenome TaxID=1070528 RepID=A0A6M3L9W9_9ZZZZ
MNKSFRKSVYGTGIKKIARLLTKDFHLREDLEQEMLLEIFKQGRYYDEKIDSYVLWVSKNRAIDYIRKFHNKEIPFGNMENIDQIINKNDTNSDF